jgi:hypothetical protein
MIRKKCIKISAMIHHHNAHITNKQVIYAGLRIAIAAGRSIDPSNVLSEEKAVVFGRFC